MRRLERLLGIGFEGTKGSQIISLLFLMVFLPSQAFANWFGGPYVEPGFAGYCVHKPTIGGMVGYTGGYQRVLKGEKYGFTPKNIECVIVNVQNKNFTETFEVVTDEDSIMNIRIHLTLKIKDDEQSIRSVVEKYGAGQFDSEDPGKNRDLGPNPPWYVNNIREPFRTAVRKAIESIPAGELVKARLKLEQDVREATASLLAETPIQLISIVAGNVEYPDSVKKEIEEKMKRPQMLESAKADVEIAKQRALSRREEAAGEAEAIRQRAQGEADAMKSIRAQLTADYISYLQAEAQKIAAGQPGGKVFFFQAPSVDAANSGGSPGIVYDLSKDVGPDGDGRSECRPGDGQTDCKTTSLRKP